MFDKLPLHPPFAVVDPINAPYAASTCAWVEHAATVTSVPQLNTTEGAAATVNVAVQDLFCPQSSVAIYVKVSCPPHVSVPNAGTLAILVVTVQPPVLLKPATHVA